MHKACNLRKTQFIAIPIFKNAIPHCDMFLENGYTKEEMKLANEPQKILNDNVLPAID